MIPKDKVLAAVPKEYVKIIAGKPLISFDGWKQVYLKLEGGDALDVADHIKARVLPKLNQMRLSKGMRVITFKEYIEDF